MPLCVSRILTIMEPTTGPLITHHRAVLSFISQQLKDGEKEERLSSGLGCPQDNALGPTVALFPYSFLRRGWLERGCSGMLQTLAHFWFFCCLGPSLCSPSRQEVEHKSWSHQRAPGQGPCSPFRPKACGGVISPPTLFLLSLKGKQTLRAGPRSREGIRNPTHPC